MTCEVLAIQSFLSHSSPVQSDKQLWKPAPLFFKDLDLLWRKPVTVSVFHKSNPTFHLQDLL